MRDSYLDIFRRPTGWAFRKGQDDGNDRRDEL